MDERPPNGSPEPPPPQGTPEPDERVERHVVVERTSAPRGGPPPRNAPMWAWVLPLVVAVVVLMWYVLTRGEPRSLFSGDPAVPTVETDPGPDVRIDLQLPEPSPTADPPPPTAEPEPQAAPPAAAPPEPVAPQEAEQP